MIRVTHSNIRGKECSSCSSTEEGIRVQVGDEQHVNTSFLCSSCSEILRDELEFYVDMKDGASTKLQNIRYEVNNSDMGTAVQNIIDIVNE